MARENPAGEFIAQQLGEEVERTPWREMSVDQRSYWRSISSIVVIHMYNAGFVIPQPEDADQVWDKLLEKMKSHA